MMSSMLTAIVLIDSDAARIPEVAAAIADRISKVEGVLRTQTYIAFRTYSQHDLEQAFALGLED